MAAKHLVGDVNNTTWKNPNEFKYHWSNTKQRDLIKKLIANTLFENEIKPFVLLGNITGAILFRITPRGAEFKWLSLITLCSIVVFTVILVFMSFVTTDMVAYFYASKQFDEKMYAQIFVVMIIPFCVIPLTIWQDCASAALYYNNWTELQITFYEVTRQILQLNLKMAVRWSLVVSVLLSILPCIGMIYLPPFLKLWQMPMPILSVLLQSNLLCFWVLTCKAMYIAGELLSEQFKFDMQHNLCGKRISKYRCLWLQLSRLCVESGYCAYRTFGVYMIFTLWIVTSGLYGFVTSLVYKDLYKTLPFIFITIENAYSFYAMCNGGYLVRKVEDTMKHELLKVTPSDVDVAVWQEIEAFLKTIANNPPIVSLGGFVNLDRRLSQSAAATIVTYLIVLVQFGTSQPDTQLDSQNATLYSDMG